MLTLQSEKLCDANIHLDAIKMEEAETNAGDTEVIDAG